MGPKSVTGSSAARAREWIDGDPDPVTRAALEALLATGDEDVLADHVGADLQFGTAGLRGVVGPGPNRMNRAVVLRATAGLAAFLLAEVDGAAERGVVVGFDGRRDSARFARDVAGALAAAGLRVHRFPTAQPTPLVAFTQKDLGAAAAVVVTASHNPAEYNGYKVYVEGAAQIVPPTDGAIAARIAAVGPASEVPLVDPDDHPLVALLDEEPASCYRAALPTARPPVTGPALTIAYTPMHGVGRELAVAALADAGHVDVHVVASQAEADPDFPTVAFPNPEEPGAMDAVLALGREVGADLVLANDPDADRIAAAVPDREGGFLVLSGNRIGVLLADHLLAGARVPDPFVVSTVVSTPMIHPVAAAHGARSVTTLTGFKWICRAMRELEASGGSFVYGFEEALGSMVGTVVADKDGVSAAVALAELVRDLAGRGEDVLDRLEELAGAHGVWVSQQRSFTHAGPAGAARIAAAMTRVGQDPPTTIAGHAVTEVVDYRRGADERPSWLGTTDLVELRLAAGRVMVRPSGTEPKCKVYVDLRGDLAPGATVARVEAELAPLAAALADDLAQRIDLA